MNRSRFDIIASILQKATPGAKKTWLMYGANLSFSQHQRYLRTLIDLGLIAEKKGLYSTTEKGLAFLENYAILLNLLGEGTLTYQKKKKLSKIEGKDTEEAKLAASSNDNIEAKALDTRDG